MGLLKKSRLLRRPDKIGTPLNNEKCVFMSLRVPMSFIGTKQSQYTDNGFFNSPFITLEHFLQLKSPVMMTRSQRHLGQTKHT
jgi:hypothetical protein